MRCSKVIDTFRSVEREQPENFDEDIMCWLRLPHSGERRSSRRPSSAEESEGALLRLPAYRSLQSAQVGVGHVLLTPGFVGATIGKLAMKLTESNFSCEGASMSTKLEVIPDVVASGTSFASTAMRTPQGTLEGSVASLPTSPPGSSLNDRESEGAARSDATFDAVFGLGADDVAEHEPGVIAVGRSYLDTAQEFVRAELEDLKDALAGGSATCDQYVHERPWSAAALAGAAGFAIGMFLARVVARRP